jgi:hypothetical protein
MHKSMLLVLFGVLSFQSMASSADDGCAVYEAEAEAFSGVVPKFNEDGTLRALLMYGEGTFLTPKRSLIADARRKAEMRARQAYAEFLKSDFDSQTLAQDLVTTAQATNQDGETVGSATELSSTLTQMRNNASATMTGVVKLDECVNTQEKYVLVTLGWKPAMSQAAAASRRQMRDPEPEVRVGSSSNAASLGAGGAASGDAASAGKVAGVELISLETVGVGTDLRAATNEALKSAVSQVFGEQFASQTSVIDSVDSASVSAGGYQLDAVVEQSSSKNAVQSSTSGVIRAWSYLEQDISAGEHRVRLSVTVPKYKSSIDSSKATMIVVVPQAGSSVDSSDDAFKAFADLLRAELETTMNATEKVTVLDRGYTKLADAELAGIQTSGNVSEMAKLGVKVGADLMLVPIVEEFQYETDRREIGEQVIERMVFNVTVSTKVIEVATTNLIDTRRFPQRNKKIRSDNATEEMALFMANRVGRHLSRKVGGASASSVAQSSEPVPDIKALKKDVDRQFKEMKDDVESDW